MTVKFINRLTDPLSGIGKNVYISLTYGSPITRVYRARTRAGVKQVQVNREGRMRWVPVTDESEFVVQ